MNMKTILENQSRWTWEIMLASAQLGEMIREDAITSVNLATIHAAAKANNINLHILSFQGASLERDYGADWLWNLNQSAYLIQAKRLDVVPSVGGLSYTIRLAQLDLLVSSSQTLSSSGQIDAKPAFVFYNSMTAGLPDEMGCLFTNAMVLQQYIYGIKAVPRGQASVTLSLPEIVSQTNAQPWYKMFSSLEEQAQTTVP